MTAPRQVLPEKDVAARRPLRLAVWIDAREGNARPVYGLARLSRLLAVSATVGRQPPVPGVPYAYEVRGRSLGSIPDSAAAAVTVELHEPAGLMMPAVPDGTALPKPARVARAIYTALPDEWPEDLRWAAVGKGLDRLAREAAWHRRPAGYVTALRLASSDAFLHALAHRRHRIPSPLIPLPIVPLHVRAAARPRERRSSRRVSTGSRAGPDDPDPPEPDLAAAEAGS